MNEEPQFPPNRIEELRKNRGWKQHHVAERLNTSVPTVQRLEKGTRGFSAARLFQLIELFELHPGELFAPLPHQEFIDIARRLTPEDRETWLKVGRKMAGE